MPQYYPVFVAILVSSWVILGIMIATFLRLRSKPKGFGVILILGPLYFVLKKQNWNISNREIYWWGLVFVLMLVAPLISNLLENI